MFFNILNHYPHLFKLEVPIDFVVLGYIRENMLETQDVENEGEEFCHPFRDRRWTIKLVRYRSSRS